MLRVRRVVRILSRLSKLRHVDVILGALRISGVDVVAANAAGLLQGLVNGSWNWELRQVRMEESLGNMDIHIIRTGSWVMMD